MAGWLGPKTRLDVTRRKRIPALPGNEPQSLQPVTSRIAKNVRHQDFQRPQLAMFIFLGK
jgi:hypothetical protein